jgi:LTXXQ motif family protein
MWKAALAGAVAIAALGSFSVSDQGIRFNTAAAQEIVVTDGQIARLRHALRLTPSQQHYWYAVESKLRSLAHQQQQYRVASADGGYIDRAQARVAGYTLTAVAMQRVRAAAQPLIAMLSDEQKEAGLSVLQSMGMSF